MPDLIKVLAEIERRKKYEHIRYFRPHDKQLEWLTCGKRIAFLLGGNRTGKTEAGAVRSVIYALGESIRPYLEDWPADLREKMEPLIMRFGGGPTRGWIFSESFEVQRDVTQIKLMGDGRKPGLLPQGEIEKITYRSSGVIDTIRLKNGSVIGFKSYDQGRDKAQGTSQHWVHLDEEPPQDIYTEVQMRVLDTQGDIFGTLTPLNGLTFVYDDIYLNHQKPPERQDPEIFCMLMSWQDNPHLSAEEIARLEAAMDPSEIEARKYGRFIMPGTAVFDVTAIGEMQKQCYPGVRGNLNWLELEDDDTDEPTVLWEEDPNGQFEVWHPPEPGTEYIVAADVAEGLEHGDFSVAAVINRTHLRLDAVYHGKCDPDVLGDEIIHKLAVYYQRALAVPERNNHGLTTINALKRKYPLIYREVRVDKKTNERRHVLGWHTTSRTRPLVINALKKVIREQALTCHYKRFIDEAFNFVRDKNGKEQAREGTWDDVIMAMAIGVYVHSIMPFKGRGGAVLVGGFPKSQHYPFDSEAGRDEDEDEDYVASRPSFYG